VSGEYETRPRLAKILEAFVAREAVREAKAEFDAASVDGPDD
jgi:hypothetical protein